MIHTGPYSTAGVRALRTSPKPISPCGGCRQKIAEFAKGDVKVTLTTLEGVTLETTVSELLPGVFDADYMSRV